MIYLIITLLIILMLYYKFFSKKTIKKIDIYPKGKIAKQNWSSSLMKNCEIISTMAPHFKVDPSSINIMQQPNEFYEYLLVKKKNIQI